VALTEAGLQALIGSIPGITGYVLCLPLLGQLSFNGGKVGADSLSATGGTKRPQVVERTTGRPGVGLIIVPPKLPGSFLDVTGGAVMMWHLPGDNSGFYKLTSTIAVILLVLPLMWLQ
jgi:hypothetical protein